MGLRKSQLIKKKVAISKAGNAAIGNAKQPGRNAQQPDALPEIAQKRIQFGR
jgi:hypothetical protein